jgi:parallel beta helix pectate lyase-like protein
MKKGRTCRFSWAILAICSLFVALPGLAMAAASTLTPGLTNQIKTAMATAVATDVINLPAGVYTEDPFTIPSGVSVIGADRRTVTIQESTSTIYVGGTGFVMVGNTAAETNPTNIVGVTIAGRGLKITGLPNDNSAKYGVYISGMTNINLTNVTVKNFAGTGINLNGANNVALAVIESMDNGGAGIFMTDSKTVTLKTIVTARNGWGGVGIATLGRYALLGTSVKFLGINSFGESGSGMFGLYLESGDYNAGGNLTTDIITWSDNPAGTENVILQASDFAYVSPMIPYPDGGSYDSTHRAFFASAADAASFMTKYGLDMTQLVALSSGVNYNNTFKGQKGDPGVAGGNGATGPAGTDGVASTVPGPQGNQGPAGPAGLSSINVPADYSTLQAAIAAAPNGSTINVAPGIYTEAGQIVINKDLTIIGHGRPVIKPASAINNWWQVTSGGALNLQNVVLDGSGQAVAYAIYGDGPGKVDNCAFVNIKQANSVGIGVRAQGSNWTITNSTFKGMERIGVYFGPGVTDGVFSGNTYTGRGVVAGRLEYGIEIGRSAVVTVTNNTITGCRGIANSDDYSAGVYVDNYYTPLVPSKAILTNNIISDNYRGVSIGYKADPEVQDTSEVIAHYNQFFGNDLNIENSSSKNLNFQNNSWGTADPVVIAASITNTTGSVDSSSPLQGQQGLKGDKGEPGGAGATGNNGSNGTNGDPGKDGSPDTPAEVVAKIAAGGNVGIGTAAPDRPLVVDSSSNTLAAGNSSFILQGESNKERMEVRSFGPAGNFAPVFMGMGARGTMASPLAVVSGDILLMMKGFGWNGAAYGGANPANNSSAADVAIYAAETHTTTAKGSYIDFQTTANGTTARATKVRIGNDGKVGIGTTAPTQLLDVNGNGIRIRTAKTPASAAAACNQGDMAWDAGFVYVCVATNTWKRSTLATW